MKTLPWLGLVLSLAGSACGATTSNPGPATGPHTTCAQIYRLLRFSPSQVQQDESTGGCVHPNLAFAGELQGQVLAAHIDQPCPRPQRGATLPTNAYSVEVGGGLYALRLSPAALFDRKTITISAAGAAQQLAELDQEPAGTGAATRTWLASSGSFTADATGTAGKLDLSLTRNIAGASPVRLTGSWTCSATQPPTTTPESTGPCGSAYAVANSPDETTGLRAGSCQVQAITLSGAVSGQIKDAVEQKVDQGLLGPTDACGGDAYHFAATLVTGLDGEELTLEMRLRRDPVTGQPLVAGDYGPASEDVVPSPTVILGAGKTHWDSQAGTLTLDASRTSGKLDMDLRGGVTGDQSVHISGSWRCA